jgi:hypothetical protein
MPTYILGRGEGSITIQREDEVTGHLIGQQLVVSNQLLADGAEVVISADGDRFMVQPGVLDRIWHRLCDRLQLQ